MATDWWHGDPAAQAERDARLAEAARLKVAAQQLAAPPHYEAGNSR